MRAWIYGRVGLLAIVAISSLFMPLDPQAQPDMSWSELPIVFIFCPIALVFVVGLQVINPFSAAVWHKPSWITNPLNFREPIQFFHLGVYVCLVQGIVMLARIAVSSAQFYAEALVPIVMAAGIFVGLKVVMRLFKSKIAHGT